MKPIHFEVSHRTETCMVLRYHYILELTTTFADAIDIQGDCSQVFMG